MTIPLSKRYQTTLIQSCLPAKAGRVHFKYTQWLGQKGGDRAHHHPFVPILQEILTDHWKSTNDTTVQHRHTMTSMTHPHHNDTTHFLCGCSKSTSTQSATFHTLTAPRSYTSLTDLWQARRLQRSKVTLRGGLVGHAHPQSPTTRALLQKGNKALGIGTGLLFRASCYNANILSTKLVPWPTPLST